MWLGPVWPALLVVLLDAVIFVFAFYLVRLAINDPRDVEDEWEPEAHSVAQAVTVDATSEQNLTQHPAMG